jgi:flagellar operon protein
LDPRIQHIKQHPLTQLKPRPSAKPVPSGQASSFKQQLAAETKIQTDAAQLKISKHAMKRLDERNIHIDQSLWLEISERVKEAQTLGVQDSLVVTNDAALVVSAKNNTVITAMNKEEARAQIFTNINGTIIM